MKKTNCKKIFEQISRSTLIFCGVVLLFLSSNMKVEAGGGTFYHVHTDACYEEEEVACTDHTRYINTISSTGHCPFCNKTCGTFVMTYYENCPVTGMSKVVDVVTTCQECGNIISTSPRPGLGYHTKTVKNLTCGKTEETPIASVSFSVSTTETTTSPVTIAANLSVLDAEFAGATYSHDGGATWGGESSKSYSENGTYSIACKDSRGVTFSETFVIDYIVKPTPPPTPAPTPAPAPEPTPPPAPTTEPLPENLRNEVENTEGTSKASKINTEKEKGNASKSLDESKKKEDLEALELTIPEMFAIDSGSKKERIALMYDLENDFAYNGKLKEGHDTSKSLNSENLQEEIQEEIPENLTDNEGDDISEINEIVREASIKYVLSSVYVKVLYGIGGAFLLVAFLGCIWYAYRNVMILYEVENKERFFVCLLVAKGTKERKVYISEKQMKKIATREILLACFRQEKEKQIAIYTPKEKYRTAWEKEIRIRI
jgi:hypothetical protein